MLIKLGPGVEDNGNGEDDEGQVGLQLTVLVLVFRGMVIN